MKQSFFRHLIYFVFNWSLIAALIFASESFLSWQSYVFVAFLIAARQHALAVLVHDGAHYRIAKNKKLNDWVSNIFGSFGCIMGTHAYRLHHLKHHQYLNTAKDPDWARKSHLNEWQFPMTKMKLAKILLKQLWSGGYEWLTLTSRMFIQGMKLDSVDKRKSESQALAFFWLGIFISSLYFHFGRELALYWFVPLFTIFPLIQRFRSISDHFAVTRDQILGLTRNVRSSGLERFLLSPHSVNWHLVHHLYPSISHYNLKRAHQVLSKGEASYLESQHLNTAYIFPFQNSVLSDLLRKPKELRAFSKAA